ncbi:hypothetical protein B0H14DRAFT_938979 [Mycena olivaceomarginata]|nr:hypothetical protein B0H14DRAFT_938979 [Mycena olivaceomarginata]
MMLIAVLAPELIVGFATRQFFVARDLSKEYKISKHMGFFVSMGGFVDSSGCPVTTEEPLDDPVVGPECLAAIRDVDVQDIMDKSKGDAFSKGLALAQGLWFCVQYFASYPPTPCRDPAGSGDACIRDCQCVHLGALVGKPLDVQRPIVIGPPKEEANVTRSRDLPVCWSSFSAS